MDQTDFLNALNVGRCQRMAWLLLRDARMRHNQESGSQLKYVLV